MATRVIDAQAAFTLIKKYRPESQVKASGGTSFIEMLCPFHVEQNPSMHYYASSDSGKCQSCHQRGSLSDIIHKLTETPKEAEAVLAEAKVYRTVERGTKRKNNTIDISDEQIRQWHDALSTDTALQVLIKKWGWSEGSIEELRIGSSEGRMVFPVYEKDDLVNAKFYTPGASERKYENKAGTFVGVWPFANLSHKDIYIVEGEKDCMTMIGQGFNAVTFTGGALTIPKQYLRFFVGKHVHIIYDIDEAGHKGSQQVAQALSRIASKVYVIDLPPEELPPKGDLTDLYMIDPQGFKARIEAYTAGTDEFRSRDAVSRVYVPPEVHKTYLENVVGRKMFYKRISMKVRVVNNAKDEVTMLPKDVRLSCSKDFKEPVCAACPLMFADGGMSLFIKPEYPEILSIIGNNTKKMKEALRSLCEIAQGCPRFNVEFKEFQAIYPIVLIPSVEADKSSHDYAMVGAWALDVPAKENEDYSVEAVVLSNPESQHLEIVCYKMDKDQTSLDDFELPPEMLTNLRIFQCADQTSQQ